MNAKGGPMILIILLVARWLLVLDPIIHRFLCDGVALGLVKRERTEP